MPLEAANMAAPGLLLARGGELTREVFGNIPAWSKGLFYLIAAVALAAFAYGCYRRVRLWRLGRPVAGRTNWGEVVLRLGRDVLLQRRVLGRGLASVAHVLLFSGFVVLLIGTTLIAIEHVLADLLGREANNPVFHKGVYYAVYEAVMDTFGIALLVGCLLFAKRAMHPPASMTRSRLDGIVLATLFVIGVTGYLIEGLRIIHEQTYLPGFSYVGLACARLCEAVGVGPVGAPRLHFGLWWLHALLALGLVAAFPYTRLLHSLAGVLNLAAPREALGVMQPVSMEELEETGMVGVGKVQDFSRRQLLMLDACVACGRCEEACPAFEAGKPLSPKAVVQDIRVHLDVVGPLLAARGSTGEDDATGDGAALHGEAIAAETLWSCTTCSACVEVCPLGISPLQMITDMRRFLVGEAELRGAPAVALQKTQRAGNPWGLPPQERFDWAKGLDVPTVAEQPDFEVLYWVGCAASYDRRVQKVARSVVRLLKAADVQFAVLGPEERCTGESARRMGDEFLFQELAQGNVETLQRHQVKKILTHCPHCLNSFKNDYPQMGGQYEVVHHSEFLQQLADEGRLPTATGDPDGPPRKVTYHDPCYLARVNGITESPRELVQLALPGDDGGRLIEMPRNKHKTSCCGAGGGRMWFDDEPSARIGVERVREALETGAETVAVACPFCLIMMGDGVAAQRPEVEVKDVAELLVDALEREESNGTTA